MPFFSNSLTTGTERSRGLLRPTIDKMLEHAREILERVFEAAKQKVYQCIDERWEEDSGAVSIYYNQDFRVAMEAYLDSSFAAFIDGAEKRCRVRLIENITSHCFPSAEHLPASVDPDAAGKRSPSYANGSTADYVQKFESWIKEEFVKSAVGTVCSEMASALISPSFANSFISNMPRPHAGNQDPDCQELSDLQERLDGDADARAEALQEKFDQVREKRKELGRLVFANSRSPASPRPGVTMSLRRNPYKTANVNRSTSPEWPPDDDPLSGERSVANLTGNVSNMSLTSQGAMGLGVSASVDAVEGTSSTDTVTSTGGSDPPPSQYL